MGTPHTLNDIFFDAMEHFSSKAAAMQYKAGGTWHGITHQEFARRVKHTALGLLELGVKKNMLGFMANRVWLWGGRTRMAFEGFQPGRRIHYCDEDTALIRREVVGVEALDPRMELGGWREGNTVNYFENAGNFRVFGDVAEFKLTAGDVDFFFGFDECQAHLLVESGRQNTLKITDQCIAWHVRADDEISRDISTE